MAEYTFNITEQQAKLVKVIRQQNGRERQAIFAQVDAVQKLWESFDADAQHWFGRVCIYLNPTTGNLTWSCRGMRPQSLYCRKGMTQADVLTDERLPQWQATVDRLREEDGYVEDTINQFGVFLTEHLPELTKRERRHLSAAARHYTTEELRRYIIEHGQKPYSLQEAAKRDDRVMLLTGPVQASSAINRERAQRRVATEAGVRKALENAAQGAKNIGWTLEQALAVIAEAWDASK